MTLPTHRLSPWTRRVSNDSNTTTAKLLTFNVNNALSYLFDSNDGWHNYLCHALYLKPFVSCFWTSFCGFIVNLILTIVCHANFIHGFTIVRRPPPTAVTSSINVV